MGLGKVQGFLHALIRSIRKAIYGKCTKKAEKGILINNSYPLTSLPMSSKIKEGSFVVESIIVRYPVGFLRIE